MSELSGLSLDDPEKSTLMNPLLAYVSSKKEGEVKLPGAESLNLDYTTQILCRLGFRRLETDSTYVRRFIDELKQQDFF